MLNPAAKLNPNLFDENVEQKPTRDGYGTGLVLAGEKNQNVVALCADLTESTRVEAFSKKFPERYFELGVAEQNMATVAATGRQREDPVHFFVRNFFSWT